MTIKHKKENKKLKKSFKNGYVMLISVLIIGAVGLSAVVSVVLLSLGSSRTSFTIKQSNEASALANACVEEALQTIWDNESYEGNSVLVFSYGECSYSISGSSIPKAIIASGTVDGVIKKISVVVDQLNPHMNVSFWQEISD